MTRLIILVNKNVIVLTLSGRVSYRLGGHKGQKVETTTIDLVTMVPFNPRQNGS